MKYKMKHTTIRFILSSALLSSLFVTRAQTVENDSSATDEKKVQVAYRKVSQDQLPGSVSYLDMEELASKSYNTSSFDGLGALVTGMHNSKIRGFEGYLVLIDGVPRDANNILQTEIESISILKGASAAVLYGSAGANGVISIVTKRGKEKPLEINVRANTGYHFVKALPNYMGAAEYMTFYNEARRNDGLTDLYSDVDIYNHGSGVNPYRYADVNLYSDDYLKQTYNRTDVAAEITGGNKTARYYSNVGYMTEGSLLNFGESTNNGTNRLYFRGNVDFTVSKRITAYVNANTSFYNSRSTNGNFWGSAASLRPNRVAPLVPVNMISDLATDALNTMSANGNIIDGKYFLGGTSLNQTHIFGDMAFSGYNQFVSRQFQFDTGFDFDLGGVVNGLSFKTTFAVDYANTYNLSYNDTYATYEPTWAIGTDGKDEIVSLTKYGKDKHSGVQNIHGGSTRHTVAWDAHFDYNRIFGNHRVDAMVLASLNQRTFSGQYHRSSFATFGGQVVYNYKNKYTVDAALAYVHSAKLAEGNRGAFSPSITLAWNAARESWLEDTAVNNLTISASSSLLHTDTSINGYYLHLSQFEDNNDALAPGWNDGVGVHSLISQYGGNPDLTFVSRQENELNLALGLWDNAITANASVYSTLVDGMIGVSPTKYPSYMKYDGWGGYSFVPYENLDSNRIKGAEVAVNFNKSFSNGFAFSLGAGVNYQEVVANSRDEVHEFDYQYREGKNVSAIYGYENLGFFADAVDVATSLEQNLGTVPQAGDIKYKDQNGDQVIDSDDMVEIGRWDSPITMGVNLTLKYKGFTLFALGTANMGGQGLKNSNYDWINGDDKYSTVVRDRWTPETASTATYPRLTTGTGSNNFQSSDFWLYDTTRFDLAKVQLTYDFPRSMFGNFFVKGLSIYVGGYNLLTFAGEKERFETNIYGGAPYTRFVNGGLKIKF